MLTCLDDDQEVAPTPEEATEEAMVETEVEDTAEDPEARGIQWVC